METTTDEITIRPPKYRTFLINYGAFPHNHLREGEPIMAACLHWLVRSGAYVLLPMPNTAKGLKTATEVLDYVAIAKRLAPSGKPLHFLPTMMITEETTVEMILEAVLQGIFDFKVYPFFRTTNSSNGVVRYWRVIDVIREAAAQIWEKLEKRIRIHFHMEHPHKGFMERDAEFMMIPIALMLLEETEATIVWEHGSDGRCVPFWKDMAAKYPGRFYLTICPQHLLTNEDDAKCDVRKLFKPGAKTEPDRMSLVALIAEDHDWVMAGPDDAPHPDKPTEGTTHAKHVHAGKCSCGAYHGPHIMALYGHALKPILLSPGGLEIFNRFIYGNALKLYKFPPLEKKLKLIFKPTKIESSVEVGPWRVELFMATETIDCCIEEVEETAEAA